MAQKQQAGADEKHGGKSKGQGGGSAGGKEKSPVQVQKYLGGLDYPCDKRGVVEKARQEGAPKEILAMLERLPERQFEGPAGISREIGKLQ